jgi:hypothetical protein
MMLMSLVVPGFENDWDHHTDEVFKYCYFFPGAQFLVGRIK